ncbi:MAG TPA: outer membrane beta-barrel protein [Kofleriaceae bacterium]
MNVRLPLVLGALVASSLGVSGVAEAQHARVHFSGGVRWSGGVNVSSGWRFARPAWRPNRWHVSGSIYVGPTYYPRPYYVYYPTYVPSYYESTTYYPVQPAVAAPGVVAVAAPRRELPKLGVGLFLGGSAVESQTGESAHESDDLGLLARFRLTPGLIVEGEIGKMSYDVDGVDNARVDRRLGASLLYEIGAYNRWAPYLLVGMGVQQAEVGDQFTTTQDYGEIGAGLRWAVTDKFHLAFELRAGSRATVDSNQPTTTATPTGTSARVITPPSESSDDTEEYTRARLNAILYF